ncbi:hypothetical protein P8C59_005442 [Phyllachora maydis]|uniref:Guanine nucleotide exchange factor LTE1 n=1 Tax=Phyllachora maydis TaxID=1825666 RepID=A0AAD9I5L2_9PEZI|nr:hypothetical protein P8C59_005442 [Phyllachora maydis]
MEGNVLPIPAPAVAFATRPRPRPPAPLQPGHDAPYERRWNSAQTFSVSGAKPLLAASGRTVRGEPGPRTIAAKAGRDDEIAPDGAFGGREGRQFAVANVGNHGRIYLRPSVRRANQRIARESDPGGFKIVISHPGEEQRPRIGEGPTRSDRPPLLDINIPTWRLGTPRFSMRGTPIIRGSFCTPTEDVRSSSSSSGSGSGSGSSSSSSLLDLTPDTAQNPAPTVVQEPQRPRPDMDAPSIPRLSRLPRAISVSSRPAVDPSIFDALTFKPACDDGAIVRYSTASGAVTAATPPRLVAEITSPSVLDYELLSDFFLTYRTFLDSSDLLRMLIARLRWALGRDDEIGIVVRVRAFVALRHWILNYFMDDFVVDYALRLEFCALLNNFVDELLWDPRGRVPPLRLLAELKKCWRRVCSQYWDGPDYDASLGANVPIMPGGIAGHRDPTLDPSFWERKDAGPPQIDSSPLAFANHGPTSFYVDVSRAGHIDWTMTGLKRPGTPDAVDAAAWEERAAASPTSLASLDVTSCSFPAKMLRHLHPGTGFPLGAHPVDPSSIPVRESSGYVDVVSSEYSPRLPEMFSLGAITERKPKRASVSIFSTNSSKPIMRPSFEAEAQKLARIPDDMDDDGGVESALLKLEGKYEKSRPISLDALAAQSRGKASANPARAGHRRVYRGEHLPGAGPPSALTAAVPWYGALTQPDPQDDSRSFLSDDSRASHSSIPLLERGLTEETRGKQLATRAWADLTILLGPGEGSTLMDGLSLQASVRELSKFGNRKGAAERVDKLEPIVSRPPSNNLSPVTDKTFLDMDSDGDDNDDGDLSSDFSAGPQSFHGHDRDDMPAHALGEKSPNAPHPARPSPDPPSPPLTLGNGAPLSPATDPAPVLQEHHTHEEKPLPPTPDTTPPMAAAAHGQFDTSPGPVLPRVDPTGTEDTDLDLAMADPTAPVKHTTRNRLSVHLPFVLAFDSDVLAQQFTLIEKDALNDIDWKELIEMRWKDSEGINSRSWVSFLRDTDARGVQVVIARFNLMVKWAISEAVLTQDIEERARCVIKFIHIAAHCRRYRNFATMGQLTIALTSNEITRLSKTWALVPTSDLQTLQELEALISPTRNFWNLRAEMEGAGKSGGAPSADLGCIPFVGIYTHDLLFNALRPSEVAGSPTSPPLINFERCRTAAAVVKTLLRLLEASTLYDFQPIEGITERCLWMAALSDEEIRSHSEGLE